MPDAVGVFEHFVRVGTDAYGIERLLRLLQAATTILLHFPSVFHLFLLFVPFPTFPFLNVTTTGHIISSHSSTTTTTLTVLRKRLATLRQPLRFFRFLDSFAAAWSVLSSLQQQPQLPTPQPQHTGSGKHGIRQTGNAATEAAGGGSRVAVVEKWLDFGNKSFTGMYLLLESAVFVEVVLDVPGLRVWPSPEAVAALVVDGQRFWFAGLVCGIIGAMVRLARSGSGCRVEVKGGEKRDEKEDDREDTVKDRAARKKVVRRLIADVMDLAVPGSVVGWVPLAPGYVALLMLGSTILRGMEVWERCGRELATQKAAARAGK
ncbi:hypothetical protein C7999DRAFT_12764 [Corynascus novoguineensis]|uniref:Uncharacterized protein n=1 Tax=Corynascus novoguineensis TaxID=1126955 RepID=A0AAN7HGW3_9PEZI|nr:hypothetical protein C7999DRAFT_12764 [Corynascus novoguineensis]